jgi:hypothetical protein
VIPQDPRAPPPLVASLRAVHLYPNTHKNARKPPSSIWNTLAFDDVPYEVSPYGKQARRV